MQHENLRKDVARDVADPFAVLDHDENVRSVHFVPATRRDLAKLPRNAVLVQEGGCGNGAVGVSPDGQLLPQARDYREIRIRPSAEIVEAGDLCGVGLGTWQSRRIGRWRNGKIAVHDSVEE